MIFKKRPDIFFALLLCIFFAGLSVLAYSTLAKAQIFPASNVLLLPQGQHLYFLKSGAECVGKMSLKSSTEKGELKFESKGSVNIQLGAKKISLPLSFLALFNSLGQLGGSLLRLQVNDGSVVFGTKGIDPISLVIKSEIPGKEQRMEIILPGPVTAQKIAQNYKISLPREANLKTRNNQPLLNTLLQSLDLSVVAQDAQQKICTDRPLGYLQLTALQGLLQMVLANVPFQP